MNLSEIRKNLHQIPELGFEEFKTQKFILSILKQFPQLKIHTFPFTGIVAEYSVGKGDYKLIRADMDALPIEEETDCDFRSQHPGKMHACGHDVHMTILLGLIEKVIQADLQQNILFVFQPAEEGKGGAKKMLETGFFDSFSISEAFALHVSGSLPLGTISSKAGIFFANTEEVDVIFKGKSAHVAFPETGKDALKAGIDFLRIVEENLQKNFTIPDTIRCVFGKMEAGTVRNAIPADCKLEGTIRAFFDDDLRKIKEILEFSGKEIAEKNGVQTKIKYLSYYKAVKNEKTLYQKLKSVCRKLNLKFEEAEAVFTGEDFGYFSEKYPGLLFWLGANQGEKQDLHSSSFLPDEKAIPIGVDVFFKLIKSE
ncbi:MAG: amidohydrolase [Candidatus Cloacimonadota bacterium]|nr:MAG: amidohydrolase [Candidatus Cloacimonadota bacterium]